MLSVVLVNRCNFRMRQEEKAWNQKGKHVGTLFGAVLTGEVEIC